MLTCQDRARCDSLKGLWMPLRCAGGVTVGEDGRMGAVFDRAQCRTLWISISLEFLGIGGLMFLITLNESLVCDTRSGTLELEINKGRFF